MNIIDAMTKYKKIKMSCWKTEKYIDTSGSVLKIVEDNKEKVIYMKKEWLLDDTWEEYKKIMKDDFEREKGEVYFYIDSGGEIHSEKDYFYQLDNYLYSHSNYFPNEAFAAYINEKQLLERDIMKFSYLNNSCNIDWNDISTNKYYMSLGITRKGTNKDDCIICSNATKEFNYIYFESEEVRDAALKLFESRIEHVLRMSLRFGF